MAPQVRGLKGLRVLIKGGGEMASGVVHRLARSGFRVCITEIAEPLSVRREVSFCEALFEGQKEVEGLVGRRVAGIEEIFQAWQERKVPVMVDPECAIRESLVPDVVIDAIMAKRNRQTHLGEASLVIGLGPGFQAGKDVHLVIETNRGHHLGRVIETGEAEPDTGTPGDIAGYTWERVLRSTTGGRFQGRKRIGEQVEKGEIVAEVDGFPLTAQIKGVLRGILRDGIWVPEQTKVGDVDPRGIREHCFTISEKARAIGGGVLEGILMRCNR